MSRYQLAAESVAEIVSKQAESATSQWAFELQRAHPFVWEVQQESVRRWESMSMKRLEQVSVGRSDSQPVGRKHLMQLRMLML